MARWIRRLFLLLLIGAGSAAAMRIVNQRRAAAPGAAGFPEWPPFEPSASGSVDVEVVEVVEMVELHPEQSADVAADWVAPVDGACPPGYPIKANDKSRIFHLPEGQFYARTVPERCYATAEAAERDGYRRAKA